MKHTFETKVENVNIIARALKQITPENYTRSLVSMESVLGDELTNNLPIGTIKEKIAELLKIALAAQTKELLLALTLVKDHIRSESKNVELVYKQDILDTVKERFNQPLKSTTIPAYAVMNEMQREAVLNKVKEVLELEELPSIDFVEKVIDIYNSGAPKGVVCNNIGITFSYKDENLYKKEHVRKIITQEPVVSYLTSSLNEVFKLIENIERHNSFTPDDLISYFNDFIKVVDNTDIKALVEEAILKSGYDESDDKVELQEITKNIISSTNHILNLVDSSDVDKFANLTERERLNEMFKDTDVNKVYLTSTQFLNVLEYITFVIRGVKLLIAMVRETVSITDKVINDLMKVDNKLDTLYNSIIEIAVDNTDTPSQEGFFSDVADWLNKGSYKPNLRKYVDGRDVLQDYEQVKYRLARTFEDGKVLTSKNYQRFSKFAGELLYKFYGVNLKDIPAENLEEFLLEQLPTLENKVVAVRDVILNDYNPAVNSFVERADALQHEAKNASKEIYKILGGLSSDLETHLIYKSLNGLEKWVRNAQGIGERDFKGYWRYLYNLDIFQIRPRNAREIPLENYERFQHILGEYSPVRYIDCITAMGYLAQTPLIHQVPIRAEKWDLVMNSMVRVVNLFRNCSEDFNKVVDEVRARIEEFGQHPDDFRPGGRLSRVLFILEDVQRRLDFSRDVEDLLNLHHLIKDNGEKENSTLSYNVLSVVSIWNLYLLALDSKL